MTKKDLTTNKALSEWFAKHSREYHNPREDITKGESNGGGAQDNMASILTLGIRGLEIWYN